MISVPASGWRVIFFGELNFLRQSTYLYHFKNNLHSICCTLIYRMYMKNLEIWAWFFRLKISLNFCNSNGNLFSRQFIKIEIRNEFRMKSKFKQWRRKGNVRGNWSYIIEFFSSGEYFASDANLKICKYLLISLGIALCWSTTSKEKANLGAVFYPHRTSQSYRMPKVPRSQDGNAYFSSSDTI
jgi:hypothetical protein